MKTKELIRHLQEEDPSGETEVNVGGNDIFLVERLPGYYDGAYQVLLRAEHRKPYYDVIGVRICKQGWKVNIRTLSVDDFLLDNTDGLVQYDSESTRNQCEENVERYRKENKEIYARLDDEREKEIEKDKERILSGRKEKDVALAQFLQGILTKDVRTEFGQTLLPDGKPLSFELPAVPDERSRKTTQIYSQIWNLLEEIKKA